MKNLNLIIIGIALLIFASLFIVPGLFEEKKVFNSKPIVEISCPETGGVFSKFVTIAGTATDPNGDQTVKKVEIMLNDTWIEVDGTTVWTHTWNVFEVEDGYYTISARAWDGAVYSKVDEVRIEVLNPEVVDSDAHKWAVFIVVSNFPEDNDSKLGNGQLYLAEEMADYFIEEYNYPTSNIVILFDDGWVRSDNGLGKPVQTLQERYHKYDITYEGATRENVETVITNMVDEANMFDDSEVFVYIASHGAGDDSSFSGGKILERSGVFLWNDQILTDKDLGDLLGNLKSEKTCVLIDSCYSGGFADKIIFNIPEFFLYKSGLAEKGRVIITGASKFRVGYASTTHGHLFSLLWFEGIKNGEADGFRPGIFGSGKPSKLNMFKDGKVSVEEAFYYARYVLKNDDTFEDYDKMEPQINDMYPRKGSLFNGKGLILGE